MELNAKLRLPGKNLELRFWPVDRHSHEEVQIAAIDEGDSVVVCKIRVGSAAANAPRLSLGR